MKATRTFAFTQRMLQRFRHDKRTLAFVLFMPLLMMLIFGYTFGGEPKDLAIAIVNNDVSQQPPGAPVNISAADAVIGNLDGETFTIRNYDDAERARQDLRNKKIWAVLVFPENFTGNLLLRFTPGGNGTESSSISVRLDDTNPNVASAIIQGIRRALQRTNRDMTEMLGLDGGAEPIVIVPANEFSEGEDIEFIDYFAPGVISFAVMMITTMLTIILLVNEKRNGTLERLLASPATETEIVIGNAMAFAFIGLCQSIVILIAAILIFDISIVGNVFLALGVVVLLGIGHQGLGILLSAGAKNELQAIQFIPLVLFPSILLAGLFWPVESIPKFLQPLSYAVPLRYAIDAERSIMLRGWGLGDIWFEVAVLVGFAVLTIGGSVLLLKRKRD